MSWKVDFRPEVRDDVMEAPRAFNRLPVKCQHFSIEGSDQTRVFQAPLQERLEMTNFPGVQ